jgi:hypothetical protein
LLEQSGMPLWRQDELQLNNISSDVRVGLFFLAECDGEAAGTVRFQLEDKLFWPDVLQHDSTFIHRLAVRRRFAGGEMSSALILWAIARTDALGRRYLRLDCEASRPSLRASTSVWDSAFTATARWDLIMFPGMNSTF